MSEMPRVLIMEDERMVRTIARVLRKKGHVTETLRDIGESLLSHDKVNLGFAMNP